VNEIKIAIGRLLEIQDVSFHFRPGGAGRSLEQALVGGKPVLGPVRRESGIIAGLTVGGRAAIGRRSWARGSAQGTNRLAARRRRERTLERTDVALPHRGNA